MHESLNTRSSSYFQQIPCAFDNRTTMTQTKVNRQFGLAEISSQGLGIQEVADTQLNRESRDSRRVLNIMNQGSYVSRSFLREPLTNPPPDESCSAAYKDSLFGEIHRDTSGGFASKSNHGSGIRLALE
jgi:hypothetical protein